MLSLVKHCQLAIDHIEEVELIRRSFLAAKYAVESIKRRGLRSVRWPRITGAKIDGAQ